MLEVLNILLKTSLSFSHIVDFSDNSLFVMASERRGIVSSHKALSNCAAPSLYSFSVISLFSNLFLSFIPSALYLLVYSLKLLEYCEFSISFSNVSSKKSLSSTPKFLALDAYFLRIACSTSCCAVVVTPESKATSSFINIVCVPSSF